MLTCAAYGMVQANLVPSSTFESIRLLSMSSTVERLRWSKDRLTGVSGSACRVQ